ncbi:hypothetical protein BD413DRAFT_149472 [Trametes elegans]|nr:hypothetical protein BD413DRAFT_149472 [Trametes elegans]
MSSDHLHAFAFTTCSNPRVNPRSEYLSPLFQVYPSPLNRSGPFPDSVSRLRQRTRIKAIGQSISRCKLQHQASTCFEGIPCTYNKEASRELAFPDQPNTFLPLRCMLLVRPCEWYATEARPARTHISGPGNKHRTFSDRAQNGLMSCRRSWTVHGLFGKSAFMCTPSRPT